LHRYFVSFVIATLLYLPLLYLLFFYNQEKDEKDIPTPIKLSSFYTEEEVTPKMDQQSQKEEKKHTPLPKQITPISTEKLDKVMKVAKNSVEESDENSSSQEEIQGQILTQAQLNALFDKKKREKEKEIEKIEEKTPDKKETQKLKNLYGSGYDSLTTEEKEYLQENISTIGVITQKYLKYPYYGSRLNMSGKNMVEFFLWPNGDISDVKLIDSSGYTTLDDNSIETIELAHKEYPYPEVKTRVRIYVDYRLN